MQEFEFGDTNYVIEFINPSYRDEVRRGNMVVKKVSGKVVNFNPCTGVVLWNDETKEMALIALGWICAMYPL